MKKQLFLFVFASLFCFVGCNEDDSNDMATTFDNLVRFQNEGTVSVSESSGDFVRIPIVMNNFASEDVTVSYTMTGDSANYNLESGSASSATIAAGTRQAFIDLRPIDNTQYNDPNNSVTINITGVSGADAVLANSLVEKTVVFVDDDCNDIAEGTYTATTASGTGAGLSYPVQVTMVAAGKYSVSDITFGLYTLNYGASDNPGVFEQSSCEVTINESESPDVVYGGDSFFGSGSFNGVDEITFSWSNHYGDNGVTTLKLN